MDNEAVREALAAYDAATETLKERVPEDAYSGWEAPGYREGVRSAYRARQARARTACEDAAKALAEAVRAALDNTTRVCPVCGGDAMSKHLSGEYLVCAGCQEMLAEDELVSKRTNQTRIAYARANLHDDDYQYWHDN
jgi:RNA polymerase subunit RPABC4/transcription elongation factor Spt4